MVTERAEGLDAVARLNQDLLEASKVLTPEEARYLVDLYYQIQRDRIRAGAQVRSTAESPEPNLVLQWLLAHSRRLEDEVKRALDRFSMAHPVGRWARSVKGIGPVIAAGLLAHIDIGRAPTVGHIWRFAGLDPTQTWNKKEKRPWNAKLRTLCWKAGESFVKVSGREDAYYGRVYVERKALETERNAAGEYAEQARAKLERFRIDKATDAYKHYAAGRLPPGHIHARAKRYAVKLFLAHLHEVWYRERFGKEPPLPYAIAILGHAHKREVAEAARMFG